MELILSCTRVDAHLHTRSQPHLKKNYTGFSEILVGYILESMYPAVKSGYLRRLC
jgi:hypothetical protein